MYAKRYYIRYKITDNVLKLNIDGNSLTLVLFTDMRQYIERGIDANLSS